MKAKDIRDLSSEEMAVELANLEEALFRLRVRQVAENQSNAPEARKLRKDIARVMTILRERELQAQKG
jgi:large subunit ribosomal protein L29